VDLEYYTSERFIHDNLIRDAEAGLHVITDWWKKKGRIPPFLITWPEDTVVCEDGARIEDKFFMDLPEDSTDWKDLIRKATEKTKAYALLFASQRENEVRVIFESRHGTKSWHFPISKHGPDAVLGEPSDQTDKCFVGLMWRPTPPESPPPQEV
jgi:hypothetical protein